ncbi:MAG: class I SAM-dependent methyltransferase [Thalassobaculaceae bacterium]|nr:class I SAM-dependent methyltransferase [Thalassobaculaceae bacterium]
MRSITAITTFNANGLETYGRKFIDSFDRHWDTDVSLIVYSEGFELAPPSDRIQTVDLPSASRNLMVFKNHYSNQPQTTGRVDGGYNYNFDAVRFAHKMFAMFDARRRVSTRYLIWLDGDIETRRAVPASLVDDVLPGDAAVAYLGRGGRHSETGFLCFDLEHPEMGEFFRTMERFYLTGEIFNLNAWHDCEIFDVTRSVFAAQGKIVCNNLSKDAISSDPFLESPLGGYMTHFKGTEATAGAGPNRYGQILRLIDAFPPSSIVEVGTWNGGRAIQMATQALRHREVVSYTGYDLFEEADESTDTRELNGKSRVSFTDVRQRLSRFAELNSGFSVELIKGDTRSTMRQRQADFAFVDGGHSVETIASDIANLVGTRIIVLDDYYVSGVDTTLFGCNRVIAGRPHIVLPAVDRSADDTEIALAVVAAPADLDRIRALFELV